MSDDPRLNTLIKNGDTGEIVIIGYPYEHAAKRDNRKGGQQNGPCCLRRFYGKVGPIINPQYQIDISNIKISDAGNLFSNLQTPEQLILLLKNQLISYFSKNQIPITIGGSKETVLSSVTAFHQFHPKGQILLLFGNSHLSRLYDNDKLTSSNITRKLHSLIPQQNLTIIGSQQKYWPNKQTIDINRIDMKDIRIIKTQISNDILKPRTQLGTLASKILTVSDACHVSISFQVIQRFLGTESMTLGGITQEEILQFMLQCGMSKCVKSLDFTQFNPSIEDYNSSLLILNMIYYFLLGYSKR